MALNAVSEDVRTLLNDNVKGVAGTDLFSFQWGSASGGKEINKQILVTDAEAIDFPIKDQGEQPVVNIMVRGETKEKVLSVHDRARDIYEFMIQRPTEEINGVTYSQFAPLGGLVNLGKDGNNRFVYSMNFFTFRCSI